MAKKLGSGHKSLHSSNQEWLASSLFKNKKQKPGMLSLYPTFLLLLTVCVLVTQLCPTLCDPMDCSLPDSSVHGILQPIPFSRGSSWPRNGTLVSCITGRFFTIWATREVLCYLLKSNKICSLLPLPLLSHAKALIILVHCPVSPFSTQLVLSGDTVVCVCI